MGHIVWSQPTPVIDRCHIEPPLPAKTPTTHIGFFIRGHLRHPRLKNSGTNRPCPPLVRTGAEPRPPPYTRRQTSATSCIPRVSISPGTNFRRF